MLVGIRFGGVAEEEVRSAVQDLLDAMQSLVSHQCCFSEVVCSCRSTQTLGHMLPRPETALGHYMHASPASDSCCVAAEDDVIALRTTSSPLVLLLQAVAGLVCCVER